jgi:hypothetical protein
MAALLVGAMTTYEYEGLICRVDMDVMGLADFNAF